MNIINNDISNNSIYLKKMIFDILDMVHKFSATSEVIIQNTTGINISVRYGAIENIEFNNDMVLTIIVYYEYRKGIIVSNDVNNKKISFFVRSVLDIARFTSVDLCSGIANKEWLIGEGINLDLFHPIKLDIKDIISLAVSAEQVALKKDKRIKYSEGGYFSGQACTKIIGNSHGILQSYSCSQYALCCSVIASSGNKMESGYSYTVNRIFNKLKSSDWVGEDCASRALDHLNACKLTTRESSVIFVSEVAVSLFFHLADAIKGYNVFRKSTFLLHCLNNIILPEWISIQEKPHLLQGIGSLPFDNEGVKTFNQDIVLNGVLQTWLLNSYSARKLNLKSTGHANGITNWCVSYRDIDFVNLIKSMNNGLIITDLMGQGINIITGDYSRGASGFWVENGNIVYPVHEITIAGNLRDMLLGIVSISNDIENRGNIQCGSVLLSSLKIAGL